MPAEINVLCVDDEPNVLNAVKRVLASESCKVHTAESVEQGLNVLKSIAPVQVVISDYRMPEMNGIEFLKQVRSAWPDTVRMVLSGYADAGMIISAINEGQIYKFIPKPWNAEELQIAVMNAIELYDLHQMNAELSRHLRTRGEEYETLNSTLQWIITDKASEMSFQSKVFEFFQNVFQALPMAAICVNAQGFIIQTNQKAKEYFKAAKISTGSRKRTEALPPDWNLFIDGMAGGDQREGMLSGIDKDLLVKGVPARFSKEEEGVILVFDHARGVPG